LDRGGFGRNSLRCPMWDAGDTAGDERTTLSRVADGNFDYFVLS
jgi:hypothetical protein